MGSRVFRTIFLILEHWFLPRIIVMVGTVTADKEYLDGTVNIGRWILRNVRVIANAASL